MDHSLTKKDFAKSLGIIEQTVFTALDYVGFVEDEPELSKEVSPHIITETKALLPTIEVKKFKIS